jgi:hypothetical protein
MDGPPCELEWYHAGSEDADVEATDARIEAKPHPCRSTCARSWSSYSSKTLHRTSASSIRHASEVAISTHLDYDDTSSSRMRGIHSRGIRPSGGRRPHRPRRPGTRRGSRCSAQGPGAAAAGAPAPRCMLHSF